MNGILNYGEAAIQNPHALYTLLHDEGPVHRAVLPLGTKAWIVTRYQEARAALSDPRLCKDIDRASQLMHQPQGTPQAQAIPQVQAGNEYMHRHMLNADPPDHTRLRKLVTKAFTARRVEGLRPRVREISDRLLAKLAASTGDGAVDLLEGYAFPLPITVMCELLGVPDGARDDFRPWSHAPLSSWSREEAQAASARAANYLTGLIEAKRAQPADDMLSALIRPSDDSDQLTAGEVLAMVFLLMVAGHESTVNLIGNGMLALLRNPRQLAALRADRGLLPSAIEEFLRFDGPVNFATLRFTTEPIELGGALIPKDELVMISLLAANRDPVQYPEPDRLDLRRDPIHIAFGHGIHYCLGAPLARLEGEIAFSGLLDSFESIELAVPAEDLVYRDGTLIHGLTRLPVLLRRHSAATEP